MGSPMKIERPDFEEEAGFFDADGVATNFFYYRCCDRASDVFLDAVSLGAIAREAENRSTYSATAEIEVSDPVRRGDSLDYEITVDRIGGKSVNYSVRVLKDGASEPAVLYRTVGVCMDMSDVTPMAIPDFVKEKLAAFASGE